MFGGFPTLAADELEADQRDSGRYASDQRLGSDLGQMLPIGSHYRVYLRRPNMDLPRDSRDENASRKQVRK
jgi:hypothetical protein